MNNDIEIPILIMAFIRPDLLKQCLNQLSKFKPPIIYVMGDGPRNNKEKTLCNESRRLALNPKWDCKVIPIFNDYNEGVVKSFVKGMDIMFSEHEYGIYLEDDILLSESFYYFAKELLYKYRKNDKVGHINATNAAPHYLSNTENSYHFNNYITEWGFATWRRMWKSYDVNMSKWKNCDKGKILDKACCNWRAKRGLRKMFDIHCDNDDPWAWGYQWYFNCIEKGALSITLSVNMSLNLGFERNDSTNTFGKNPIASELETCAFPLIHPSEISRNWDLDKEIERIVCPSDIRYLRNRIFNKLKNMFPKR